MSTARPASGTFFFVVGPSGAGKDTLIDGARVALAGQPYVFAQRVITRPANAAGEQHEAETDAGFARRLAAGEFLVSWQAHGLSYGLPASLLPLLAAGTHVIANGSRAVAARLAERLPTMVIIEVTAPAEILAQRIAGRGRESAQQALARLSRQVDPIPIDLLRHRVANDGEPALGIQRFLAALHAPAAVRSARAWAIDTGGIDSVCVPLGDWPAGTRLRLQGRNGRLVDVQVWVQQAGTQTASLRLGEMALPAALMQNLSLEVGQTIRALPLLPAASRPHFIHKLRGGELAASAYEALFADAIAGCYDTTELTTLLVEISRCLEAAETLALAQARSRLAPCMTWSEVMVVDKHSLGGVPGSRITLIVTPIVAAHGLAMPKASSRAITSASGTAEAMAVLANVDLDAQTVRRCVHEARACIAWNGRLNHSVIDDVMNRITRPLGLRTGAWSVASILSKKKTAGVTHLIVDVPYGPHAKQATRAEAQSLCHLFEQVGAGLGLHVKALPTDGTRPIGRGIGPVLETRDALQVLDGDRAAPQDLREKALRFAAHILAWDPSIGNEAVGRSRAEHLLQTGAARAALDRIIEAQGRRDDRPTPTTCTHTVVTTRSGIVKSIDGWQIAGLARDAGAPACEGAGIDLLCSIGQQMAAGQPLYRIHAANDQVLSKLEAKLAVAAMPGITLD